VDNVRRGCWQVLAAGVGCTRGGAGGLPGCVLHQWQQSVYCVLQQLHYQRYLATWLSGWHESAARLRN
jgi:hypothetical protein